MIEEAVRSVIETDYPHKRNITILLATEARAPDARDHAEKIISVLGTREIEIINIVHPDGIEGEGRVK